MYHIENFKVLDNTDEYRVADHLCKLQFHVSTFIKKLDVTWTANEYNFISIKDLADRKANNVELIGISFSIFIHIL